MKFTAINPATGEQGKSYNGIGFEEAREIAKKAAAAQKEWKETPFSDRAIDMKKAAAVLRKRKRELAEIAAVEMGKPIAQGMGEVEKCALVCDYYAENAEKFLADEQIKTENSKVYTKYQPLGVVLAVMPWNFPFWQVFRFAAPSLMAGNAGLLKHASNVPGCSVAIQEVFDEAGFPSWVFTSLMIDSESASKLIDVDDVSAVTLTGSTEAGRKIAERAGRNIKKCVLELGGSDPFIVLDDVDVKQCAASAVQGRIVNSGQSCIAAKRFIVNEKIREEFEKDFAEHMKTLKVGDPLDESTQVGPLARKDIMDGLLKQIDGSVKMGAKIITGGKRKGSKGFFVEPTVVTDVRPAMPVFAEETFGPVACVIGFEKEEEAMKLANMTEYGLGASVWSKDVAKAERLAARIDAGAVFVNKVVASDPRVPFGGIKKSGYGRELGRLGILEFMNAKSVVVQ
jgi:succinate-semialdehyde dehydrogenase/glutarate-semialdehyde dehydrogenase